MFTKENAVKYVECLLNLKHHIAGARFINTKEEYDALSVPEYKGTMCMIGRKGVDGDHVKADATNVVCDYGAYAVGIKTPHQSIRFGRSYADCGLYNGKTVAREIVESMHFLDQEIHGIETGAVSDIENPDLVYIMCDPRQAMIIFQGYAYKYGNPEHLSFFGNQATCADLLSKPFYNNDINLSLFCEGTRKYGHYTPDELGVSMPYAMFEDVCYGVYKVIDPVLNFKEKKEASERLAEHGLTYDFSNFSYGDALIAHDSKL